MASELTAAQPQEDEMSQPVKTQARQAWLEATGKVPSRLECDGIAAVVEAVLAQRTEAPAQTVCDNSSGQPVLAAPSCVPTPPIPSCIPCSQNSIAAGEVPIPYAPAPSCVPAERTFTAGEFEEAARKVGCVASIGWILAALDPPKTKTPQERIEAILSRRGYTWSQDDARSIAAEIVAELAKEQPKPKTPIDRVNAILAHDLGNEYVVKHTTAAKIVAELSKERP